MNGSEFFMEFITGIMRKMYDKKEHLTPKLKVKCDTCCLYVELISGGMFTVAKINNDPYEPNSTEYFDGNDDWYKLNMHIAKHTIESFSAGYW